MLEMPLELSESNVFVRRESANSPPSYLKLSGENFSKESLLYQRGGK